MALAIGPIVKPVCPHGAEKERELLDKQAGLTVQTDRQRKADQAESAAHRQQQCGMQERKPALSQGNEMDIKTLEALGINADELANRVVEQAVEALLYSTGFNPETEEEVTYESNFKRAIEKKIQGVVDQKISEIAEAHIMPRVGEMIEKADMRKTNHYGEPQTPSLTFKEYMAYRAENYMTEDVDFHGKSKADLEAKGESTYNWRSCGPRLTVLMRLYIADSMEKAAKAAVNDVNTAIAKSIEKAAKDAIAATAANIKVSVGA